MARRRQRELAQDESSVPAELKNFEDPVWVDPNQFRRWVLSHLRKPATDRRLEYLCRPGGHGDRFDYAVDAWATDNGFVSDRHPRLPDRDRLRHAGIVPIAAPERAGQRRRLLIGAAAPEKR